jgi:hypothetical protein
VKLTGRQKAFLSTFLQLYRDVQKPLHYADVAEAFGVAKNTAYDMLRLLERRGLVRLQYVVRGKGQGAGRSTVVSLPTPQAYRVLAEQVGAGADRSEWERVKAYILEALEYRSDYQNLLEEIVAELSERSTPLVYTAQMAAAAILNLLLVEREVSAAVLVERLRALGLPGEVGLSALSGLTVGLSFAEPVNRRVTAKLVAATHSYQQSLSRLSAESKRHLSAFVQEVMQAIAA